MDNHKNTSPPECLCALRDGTCSRAPRFSLRGFQGWAYCDSVYDGDTCQLSFLHPNSTLSPYRWTCRLARIETPEIGRKAASPEEHARGIAARDTLAKLLLRKLVWIHITSMGKYKRPVVEIYTSSDESTNVNNEMLACGAAKPYGAA